MSNLSKRSFVILLFITILICSCNSEQTSYTKYVDPMIGTGGHGHTYPGATLPFGMVQLSPDNDITGWDWCSGYHYSDNSIMGFSHTHLSGTGCTDYGDILLMPTVGKLFTNAGSKENPDEGYRSRFSHENEVAKPGYYSVKLDDYNVDVELTVTKRAGFHKYTFKKNDSSHIIIDLVHGIQDKAMDAAIEILDDQTIQGYRQSNGWGGEHTVFFYAQFSKPFQSSGIVEDEVVNTGIKTFNSDKVKAVVNYATEDNETILVKIGISHTDIKSAKENLEIEITNWDFEEIKKLANSEWEKELSKIVVKSKSQKEKTIFYTALYHSFISPDIFSNVDGSYMGMDGKIKKSKNGEILTTFSLWDTFRGLNPLLTIIDKDKANSIVNTLIHKYEESGLLPVWELAANETGQMIGYHSVPIIVDAYFKGIRNYDVGKAFTAMKTSAMQDTDGLDCYKEMGFIQADLEPESVSKTLEYAYDDWCIAMMAKDLGKEDDYQYFIERSKFYLNLFDSTTQLMRPKKNGKWLDPFDPYSVSGNYTEANAWQYSFFVPQDISGLIELMGGDKEFNSKLDEVFTASPELTGRFQIDITGLIGQYAHGNEPSHHMAYLYNYSGEPWKTQEKVHEIVKTLYTEQPDGISGNEDCGQMSAWYVLSSTGFYSVCPGDGTYIIGTPNFDEVKINCDGNDFIVRANNLSDDNLYIQSAKLNGKEYPYSFIKHSNISKGGKLVFEMGSKPSKWGAEKEYRPISKIDYNFVQVPYLVSGERIFKENTTIELKAIDSNSKIYFTTDGRDPKKSKIIYEAPIKIDKTTTIKSVCELNGIYSKVVTSQFNKLSNSSIELKTIYQENYTGGGKIGLIDGIKGPNNFRADAWQGYEGVDLNAVIDLGVISSISNISMSFFQDTKSWIFLPKEINYYVSKDGIDYDKVSSVYNSSNKKDIVEGIKDINVEIEKQSARFIKVIAKNLSVCPEWHIASGGKSWLFVDEISIN